MTTEKQDEQNGCLKFSRNTWHYKVVTNVFGKYFFSAKTYRHGGWVNKGFDTSLCEYFWTVVLCCIVFQYHESILQYLFHEELFHQMRDLHNPQENKFWNQVLPSVSSSFSSSTNFMQGQTLFFLALMNSTSRCGFDGPTGFDFLLLFNS